MKLHVIKAIEDIVSKHFENLLKNGAFPKVGYSETVSEDGFKWRSYSMFDYSDTYARFTKLVDFKMKQTLDTEMYGQALGIFTRKHSPSFLAEVEKLVNEITEGDVLAHADRFRSFADAVREEAVK